MKCTPWSMVVCVALVAGSCSEDELARRAPKLVITADTDGYHYKDYDDDPPLIDLGEVPVFATKLAVFKLSNPTGIALEVHTVTYTTINGQMWKDPDVVPSPAERRFLETAVLDFQIPPYGEVRLHIPFAPLEELPGGEQHLVVADIESNAANGRVMKVKVKGKAVFTGAPDIQVEYNAYVGPDPRVGCFDTNGDGVDDECGDCVDVDTDGVVEGCLIPTANAL
ncbi:MAG: hypothetical protein V3T05_10715, partial [Myxococcota bacterium]